MPDVKFSWPSEDNKVIPRRIFFDPDLYETELERIFQGPTWHLIGHESEIPRTADYKRHSIANVPLFSVRGQDGVVRTFINACAHRGAEVVNSKFGNASNNHLRCIYHMWSYDLTGQLTGVALPDEFPEDFQKGAHGLMPVRTETFLGCIFATLSSETPPLQEYLGETMIERMQDCLGDGKLKPLGSQTAIFRCNWKLYMENLFDSYHAPVLHAAVRILKSKAAPGSRFDVALTCGGTYAHTWTRYQAMPIEEKEKTLLHDYSLFDIRSRETWMNYVLGIFPGAHMCHQLDVLQLRYVRPISPTETEIEFANFAHEGESEELVAHRVRQANLLGPVGLINLEDGCALERVQWSASAGGDNYVLKGAIPGRPPYGYAEEGGIREMYASYRKLMGL